jgi:predicted RNA-binding protein (virulence factor B family)
MTSSRMFVVKNDSKKTLAAGHVSEAYIIEVHRSIDRGLTARIDSTQEKIDRDTNSIYTV